MIHSTLRRSPLVVFLFLHYRKKAAGLQNCMTQLLGYLTPTYDSFWNDARGRRVSQFSSVSQSCPTLYNTMGCSMPGLPVHHPQSLPNFVSITSVMPSNYLILCYPLLLLPSICPRVFSSESAVHIRWPKYCICSIISPISYGVDNGEISPDMHLQYLYSSVSKESAGNVRDLGLIPGTEYTLEKG